MHYLTYLFKLFIASLIMLKINNLKDETSETRVEIIFVINLILIFSNK